jgi:hypothetical protein
LITWGFLDFFNWTFLFKILLGRFLSLVWSSITGKEEFLRFLSCGCLWFVIKMIILLAWQWVDLCYLFLILLSPRTTSLSLMLVWDLSMIRTTVVCILAVAITQYLVLDFALKGSWPKLEALIAKVLTWSIWRRGLTWLHFLATVNTFILQGISSYILNSLCADISINAA